MSQVLELVYIGVFLVMIVSAMLNAGAVRVQKARVESYRTAIKLVIATPLFWLQLILTVFCLVIGVLARLETYFFAEIVREVLSVLFAIFVVISIGAALGFYFAGEFITKEDETSQ